MMLCPVVCIIEFFWLPIEPKLFLALSVSQPVEAHVRWFCSLGLDPLIDDTFYYGIVHLYWFWWLLVSYFVQDDLGVYCLASAVSSASVDGDMTYLIMCPMLRTLHCWAGCQCCWKERSGRLLGFLPWARWGSRRCCGPRVSFRSLNRWLLLLSVMPSSRGIVWYVPWFPLRVRLAAMRWHWSHGGRCCWLLARSTGICRTPVEWLNEPLSFLVEWGWDQVLGRITFWHRNLVEYIGMAHTVALTGYCWNMNHSSLPKWRVDIES